MNFVPFVSYSIFFSFKSEFVALSCNLSIVSRMLALSNVRSSFLPLTVKSTIFNSWWISSEWISSKSPIYALGSAVWSTTILRTSSRSFAVISSTTVFEKNNAGVELISIKIGSWSKPIWKFKKKFKGIKTRDERFNFFDMIFGRQEL